MPKKFTITTTMMFTKNNREKSKLDAVKKKKFDYKRLKLSDDYNYTSDN